MAPGFQWDKDWKVHTGDGNKLLAGDFGESNFNWEGVG